MVDSKFDENPWSSEYWNLTRQGEYVTKYGVEVAKTKARQAGVKFGSSAPRAPQTFINGRPPFQVIVQRRNIGGGGGGGQGSSGDGPPS